MSNSFICDATAAPIPFPHFWEHTIGSGHATLALRADYQQQLKRCHDELGFMHVRFHGILSDNMGTLMCENEKLVYSFFNTDQIFDFLLSIGMRPFVELSFMPTTLSSGPDIVFKYKGNITPPANYKSWADLIDKLVRHWGDRYGIEEIRKWFFEIWNEPNLSAFWTGTQQDYFNLYKYSCTTIKNVDANLKVGGPATASNAWIPEFKSFCATNNIPYDFISTHHYPTDAFGKPGDDTITELADSTRSILQQQIIKTRAEAGNIPVYYTEWSTSSNPFDELHDLPYAAAFIVKTVMEARGNVQGYSYWTFSDIFEENYFSSIPFHGGFGLLNIYGIPKPSYRAFELLHRLGDELIPVQGEHETVDVWVSRKEKTILVLLTNAALPRHPVKTETINIKIKHSAAITSASIERIDDTHCNSAANWNEMGKPDSLSPDQVLKLEQISSLVKEPFKFIIEDGSIVCNVIIPPQGIVLLTVA